ncbi:hypothetical protein SXCC_00379 [Gluconacetobacter sp. SXCC-1]|nr:hypothetical protein SXCC_00379 [Gluconacetobacter sp. SXCC-1]
MVLEPTVIYTLAAGTDRRDSRLFDRLANTQRDAACPANQKLHDPRGVNR